MAASAVRAVFEQVKVLLTSAPESRYKFFDVLIPLDTQFTDKRLERPGRKGRSGLAHSRKETAPGDGSGVGAKWL